MELFEQSVTNQSHCVKIVMIVYTGRVTDQLVDTIDVYTLMCTHWSVHTLCTKIDPRSYQQMMTYAPTLNIAFFYQW